MVAPDGIVLLGGVKRVCVFCFSISYFCKTLRSLPPRARTFYKGSALMGTHPYLEH